MKSFIQAEIITTARILDSMVADDVLLSDIAAVATICITALKNGSRILLAGNGGSAADAQHLAAELVGKLLFDRPALSALALTTNSSALTAISNDYSYDLVFARQIEAIGQAGDVFIGISTSGCSRNLILALKQAKKKRLVTVGILGVYPGDMGRLCDYCIHIPNNKTHKIQECHGVVGHIICALIEKDIFSG